MRSTYMPPRQGWCARRRRWAETTKRWRSEAVAIAAPSGSDEPMEAGWSRHPGRAAPVPVVCWVAGTLENHLPAVYNQRTSLFVLALLAFPVGGQRNKAFKLLSNDR